MKSKNSCNGPNGTVERITKQRRPSNRFAVLAIVAATFIVFGARAELIEGRVVEWNCPPPVRTNSTEVIPMPSDLTNAVAVSAGYYQKLALRRDGTLAAWGRNTNVPSGLTNIAAISAGGVFSMALRGDGTVVGWGTNLWGQPIVPSGISNVTAIAAGYDYGLALRTDGTVIAWGTHHSPPAGATNVVAIAAGSGDALGVALRSDGTVLAWGYNRFGETNVPPGVTNVVSVAAGAHHCLALRSNGTVIAWGYNFYGQTNVPPGLSNVVAIAAGGYTSMALKNDGTVILWGSQTNVPLELSNVVAISQGGCSLAIAVDLKICSIGWTNGKPAIRFQTFSGRQYATEYSTDLNSNHWLPLAGLIEGNGRIAEQIDTSTNSDLQRFYRIVEWPQ